MFVLNYNLSFIACFRTLIFVSWNSRVISSDILKNQKSQINNLNLYFKELKKKKESKRKTKLIAK